MNNSTYARRTYSSSRPTTQTEYKPGHPAQSAVNGIIEQYEGKYEITAEFTRDHASMDLFKRENSVVIGFICTLYDETGRCLSQGRGLSFVGYQGDKYIQRGILYARNASLIDCAMRASKLSTVFVGDDKESDGKQQESGNYYLPADVKPSDKQIKYLTGLLENLSSEEQNDIMSRLPQMDKFEVSQLINRLKD